MSEKIWEEMKEGFMEGCSDILNLCVDVIAAPVLAICRVTSDFVHGRGKYAHPDRESRRAN